MHSQEDLKCLCIIAAGMKQAGVLLLRGIQTHNKWAPRGNNREKTHTRCGALWVEPGDGEAEPAAHAPRGPRPQGWPPAPSAARPPPPVARPLHAAPCFRNTQSERHEGPLLLECPRELAVLTNVLSFKTHPACAPILQAK